MSGTCWLAAIVVMVVQRGVSANLCFPGNFMFGTATAAYQVEGGWNETMREPSIWDMFCRKNKQVQCANVADDMLHQYKSDVELMSSMGLDAFRLSVSWSRVMNWNNEKKRMVSNPLGITFYRNVLDELILRNITPSLTLYHWDLPEALQTELDPPGWLNPNITDHFLDFAKLVFEEYGMRVPYFATFNEPQTFVTSGYADGVHAPGYKNSDTLCYAAAHNVLRSHANAVQLFRSMRGKEVREDARISIVLNFDNAFPLAEEDKDVPERANQFKLGWYLLPIIKGEYPQIMRETVGDRLPEFTSEESKLLTKSYDLLMLNHYTTLAVTRCDSPRSMVTCQSLSPGWRRDLGIDDTRFPPGAVRSDTDESGKYLCEWFAGVPGGYLSAIRWMHKHDPSADILLTENGFCGNDTINNPRQLWYLNMSLTEVKQAIDEGISIVGYMAWSFMDNYEWGSYGPRFGLVHVQYPESIGSVDEGIVQDGDLKRTLRSAAKWYSQLSKTKCLPASKESASLWNGQVWKLIIGALGCILIIVAMVLLFVCCRKWKRNGQAEREPLLQG